MAVQVFYDEDANPDALRGERVAVLGYGIQGRAQALTLRDSGVDVRVGNRDDAYLERSQSETERIIASKLDATK